MYFGYYSHISSVIYKYLLIILFAVKKFLSLMILLLLFVLLVPCQKKTITAKSSIRKLIPYILF